MSTTPTMSDHEIEEIILKARGFFAVDGMILTQEEDDRGRRLLRGEITIEEAHAEIYTKYGLKQVSAV